MPYIAPSAAVDPSARIGSGSQVWHFAQIRENAVIGRDCLICTGAYIGVGVRLGDNVKVENGAVLFKGVTVEDDVFIGPHVVFTNDKYPRSFVDDWKLVKTYVERGVSIGANSTILCGITIGEYAMIGSGSVVTKDVPAHSLVYGSPAEIVGVVCKFGHPDRSLKPDELRKGMRCEKCGREML